MQLLKIFDPKAAFSVVLYFVYLSVLKCRFLHTNVDIGLFGLLFQEQLFNYILVALRQQVRSSTIPQLPRHRELFSSLSPYHEKLVGESYLGRKRPIYECTDVQVCFCVFILHIPISSSFNELNDYRYHFL